MTTSLAGSAIFFGLLGQTYVVIISSFIFTPGNYDQEFYELDAAIADIAKQIPGFLDSTSWVSKDGKHQNSTYYWESMEALMVFVKDPKHQQAKQQYARWYQGYKVEISEKLSTYGDGNY